MNLYTKQELLICRLQHFYKTKNEIEGKTNYDILLDILNPDNIISLRTIDWYITNYSKKKNIILMNNNNRFVIFLDYKSQLKAYSKKYFDPFCRRDRIIFNVDNKEEINTTVGQLNFFCWVIENNIIKNLSNDLCNIELDMHNSLKKAYSPKTNKNRKKRSELSISANKRMTKEDIQIVLKF